MSDFRKLEVWQKAHELMLRVHEVMRDMRGPQYLSLRNQILRAAMSIPANIVEGRAQRSDREFSRFVGYAIASSSELEYHLFAATEIGVLSRGRTDPLVERTIGVRRMLIGLRKTLLAAATPSSSATDSQSSP